MLIYSLYTNLCIKNISHKLPVIKLNNVEKYNFKVSKEKERAYNPKQVNKEVCNLIPAFLFLNP